MYILECSTRGDIRFSAFGAKVEVGGIYDSIENHYQNSKRTVVDVASCSLYTNTVITGKGKRPDFFVVCGIGFDVKYFTAWYKLLWVKYLDSHPELVTFASQFDDFHDTFKGKSINCQADVIRQYVKDGRDTILREPDVRAFTDLLKLKRGLQTN